MHLDNTPDKHEAAMARADLYKLANYSMKLFKMIHEGQELEGWVQAKITKAADYVSSVYHFMQYEMKTSDYGDKLENSDIYSESVRRAFEQKLMEAKRQAEKIKKDSEKMEEGFDDLEKYMKEKDKPQPKGGAGKKQGSKYGGSKQKDDEDKEKDVKEGFDDMEKYLKSKKGPQPSGGDGKKSGSKYGGSKQAADKDDEEDTNKKDKKVKETMYFDPNLQKNINAASAKQFMQQGQDKISREKELRSFKDRLSAIGKSNLFRPDMKSWDVDDIEKAYAKEKGAKAPKLESAKPDYLDFDKDGNKKEPMKKALKDKKVKEDLQSGTSGAQAVRYYANATRKVFDAAKTNQQLSAEWMNYLSEKNKQDQISPRGLETSATEDGQMAMKLLKKYNIPLEDPKQPSMLDKAVSGVKGALGMKESAGCNQTMEGKSCPVHGMKECPMEESAKKGLYYNVNKRKAAGTSRDKGHPKAPSAQDWKNAAKTAKK